MSWFQHWPLKVQDPAEPLQSLDSCDKYGLLAPWCLLRGGCLNFPQWGYLWSAARQTQGPAIWLIPGVQKTAQMSGNPQQRQINTGALKIWGDAGTDAGVLKVHKGQKVSLMKGGYNKPHEFHGEFLGLNIDIRALIFKMEKIPLFVRVL